MKNVRLKKRLKIMKTDEPKMVRMVPPKVRNELKRAKTT